MSGFKKFRDGFIGPILILTVISLLVTWAVAATHTITAPEIEKVNEKIAREARQAVLPDADDFIQYKNVELPAGVEEAYKAANDTGFVFLSASKGFDGNVPYMIGVDMDGKVINIKMMDNGETPGLGSKVGNPEYLAQFQGQSSFDDIQGITGATKTSGSLKGALAQAMEAYALVKDTQPGEGN